MSRLAAFVAIVLACCCASAAALAGKRVALVVGNSAYQNVNPLANPANDAGAIAEMFKKAGFDVVDSRRDLKAQEMRRALREFTDKARGADIAVIYFAGHGLEVDGTNYVVPVDAVLERDADVDDEAVSLNRILMAAEPATRLRLVILDACRDNPFTKKMKRTLASRAVVRGLIGVEATRPNTFIAFAAKEGSTAADGDGANSPFTTALLKYLPQPGLDIRKAFGFVRDEVMSATGDQQEPYTTNSLGGNDVALVPAPEKPQAPAANANAEMRHDYELAERVGTLEAWDFFVAAHPTGFYADWRKPSATSSPPRRRACRRRSARVWPPKSGRGLRPKAPRPPSRPRRRNRPKRLKRRGWRPRKRSATRRRRLAAAEAVKQAEQQRLAAEEAKKLEQAKVAAIEQPETHRSDCKTGRGCRCRIAAGRRQAATTAYRSAAPVAD